MQSAENKFRLTGETRIISGNLHHKIECRGGFCFYLDEAFLYALENHGKTDFADGLIKLGATSQEVSEMIALLVSAGLIDVGGEYGKSD